MIEKIAFGVSIAFGICIPLLVYGVYRQGQLTRPQVLLFAIGSLLGVVWEGALVVLVPRLTEASLYSVAVEVPVSPVIHVMSHSFWDGGLFLVGVLVVERAIEPPHFQTFRWRELGVLVAWGQIQSLAVEITAVVVGLWMYHPTSLNPALFQIDGGAVTVGPQLIWLVAAIVFYCCCLAVYRREHETPTPS